MPSKPEPTGARRVRGPALALGILAACSEPAPPDARPLVVVSVTPQAYFVERLAGERVRVEVLIPPGANHVTYEPSLDKLRAVSEASLYVRVGHRRFPFEQAWLEPLLAERPELEVVDASRGVEHQQEDPHVWVTPRHARMLVESLHPALVRLLPDAAPELEARRRELVEEIDAVDAELREVLAPVRGRRFYVFHPAWGYLAEEYGLEQVPIEQRGKEPDARALADLIAEARREGVRVVFSQPQFDPVSARVLADAIGARVELLDPLAPDWPDNLRRSARRIAAAAVE